MSNAKVCNNCDKVKVEKHFRSIADPVWIHAEKDSPSRTIDDELDFCSEQCAYEYYLHHEIVSSE